MFNLGESINAWKCELNKKNILSQDDLEELEAHLMDEITLLKEKDLSEEEAFLVAKNRLGEDNLIQDEYEKVNHNRIWMHKLSTLFIGYISFQFIMTLIHFFGLLITILVFSKYPLPNSPIKKFSFIVQLILLLITTFSIFSSSFSRKISKLLSLGKMPKAILLVAMLLFNFYGISSLINGHNFDFTNEYISNYISTISFANSYINTISIPLFIVLFFIIKKVKNRKLVKA